MEANKKLEVTLRGNRFQISQDEVSKLLTTTSPYTTLMSPSAPLPLWTD